MPRPGTWSIHKPAVAFLFSYVCLCLCSTLRLSVLWLWLLDILYRHCQWSPPLSPHLDTYLSPYKELLTSRSSLKNHCRHQVIGSFSAREASSGAGGHKHTPFCSKLQALHLVWKGGACCSKHKEESKKDPGGEVGCRITQVWNGPPRGSNI